MKFLVLASWSCLEGPEVLKNLFLGSFILKYISSGQFLPSRW